MLEGKGKKMNEIIKSSSFQEQNLW